MPSMAVPSYGLYGESSDKRLDMGIHMETIESRSRGQNWTIRPHRHGSLYQLLIVLDGAAEVECAGLNFSMRGVSALTLPIGTVHGFRFTTDCRGFVVSLAEELLAQVLADAGGDFYRLLAVQTVEISFTAAEQSSLLEPLLQLLHREVGQLPELDLSGGGADVFRETADMAGARELAVLRLLELLFIALQRRAEALERREREGPRSRVFHAFRGLLEDHYREEKRVERYAGMLNVSTSTLNRICHAEAGSSAKAIIDGRVIAEARRRLRYTRQSLAEIAGYLGYRDPAYFSRAFKKAEKITPGAFRRAAY